MMENMNSTPLASRFTIGLFGRRNVGKSSLLNALAGQPVSVISAVAGTTTDPVQKAMELLPIGPVVLVDTAGLDDTGDLGKLRIQKTYEALRKCHLALVVADANEDVTPVETDLIADLQQRNIPAILVLNQCDRSPSGSKFSPEKLSKIDLPVVYTSAKTGLGIDKLKQQIIEIANAEIPDPVLVRDLVQAGDLVVLVTPIDAAAPKGRIILPQQQTIRDLLDGDAMAIVTTERKLVQTLSKFRQPPALVITDSQAFAQVSENTPSEIPMTSFSILFARQKGDLAAMVRGARHIEKLKPGSRVLIVEGCTHHRQTDDIGTVKIPQWIRKIAGNAVEFEWASGSFYPGDIAAYDLIVHCGGCMLNRREVQHRISLSQSLGTPITNYGVLIAYVLGILPRALKPFPEALFALENTQ